jgi:hypothetical protein
MEFPFSFKTNGKTQLRFIGVGCLCGITFFLLYLKWNSIVCIFLGKTFTFYDLPPLAKSIHRLINWLPWAAALVYFIIKRNIGRVFAYIVGLILSWIVIAIGSLIFVNLLFRGILD